MTECHVFSHKPQHSGAMILDEIMKEILTIAEKGLKTESWSTPKLRSHKNKEEPGKVT